MPLQSGGAIIIPGDPGDPGTPGGPPIFDGSPFVGVDLPRATWIDPRAGEWPLTQLAAGWWTTDGIAGVNAASPGTIVTDDNPRGGATVRQIQVGPRTITWPLFIEGQDHAEFIGRFRRLQRAFLMTRTYGPGQLVITRPDGTSRAITAYYEDGWKDTSDGSLRWEVVALSLFCPSPYWSSRTPIVETRAYQDSAPPSFLSPFPQIATQLGLGRRSTLFNPGEVEAWPLWEIRGPMESVTAINHTVGASWALDFDAFRSPLVLGETVNVITDPSQVYGPSFNGETGWAGALNWPDADLWPVVEGENDIEYIAVGAAAGSSVTLRFYPRYESA